MVHSVGHIGDSWFQPLPDFTVVFFIEQQLHLLLLFSQILFYSGDLPGCFFSLVVMDNIEPWKA